MKAEQELELLGKALGEDPEEETIGAAVNKLREELEKTIAENEIVKRLAQIFQVPAEILFGRKKPAAVQGPPLEVTHMDSEITASDEELLAYFREIMLQKRIDRMDMIERMTHAAATLIGGPQEWEMERFHTHLQTLGFNFDKAIVRYLSVFYELYEEHERGPIL